MILQPEDRVVVAGLTGSQGSFWSEKMMAYGTRVVGGISASKAGTNHLGVPVMGRFAEAADTTGLDVAVMFVPPTAAPTLTIDAIQAGARTVVVLTEFIPVHDTMRMVAVARERGATIVGPNTAGTVTVGSGFAGFMPAFNDRIFRPGAVGVVSRSGSLGTLACMELTRAGRGQSVFIGIGGDPVSGTSTLDALRALENHDGTEAVVLIGEIGGSKEEDAAEFLATMSKPVAAFIAGRGSPPGKKMGHAGALIVGDKGTYQSKRDALTEAGATVVDVPSLLPEALG